MSFHAEIENKIVSREKALSIVSGWKLKGKKVVFTNGCFDIIHPGHIESLSKARDLGNALIVGLNTDDSVRRLNKAPNRPINDELSRAKVLAGLSAVDLVINFNEDTPLELINFLKPDVLVKGGDYKPETIVGYREVISWGGEVVIIPLLNGHSTTNTISKMSKP